MCEIQCSHSTCQAIQVGATWPWPSTWQDYNPSKYQKLFTSWQQHNIPEDVSLHLCSVCSLWLLWLLYFHIRGANYFSELLYYFWQWNQSHTIHQIAKSSPNKVTKIPNLHKNMKSKLLKGGMLWTDDSYVNPPVMLGLNYNLLPRM
jgi:hypothetical protein